MTMSPSRPATSAPAIPRPRAAEPELPPVAVVAADPVPELPPAHFPWPEPWGSAKGARPRTEYWDVATAGWRSRGPAPHPEA